jgi:4-hydroxy-3-methylbut-2-en-1-yl diphosphate reductase
MIIEIEARSGFCFGVARAVEAAEKAIQHEGELFCLGEIVHNREEIKRLQGKGMKVATQGELKSLSGKSLLIRAHGEPPETYETIRESDIKLIDATCPVVLKLQQRVKTAWEENPGKQIVIYGKPGHPEVVSLSGQTAYQAIVVADNLEGLEKIDFNKPIELFCQTTQSMEGFRKLVLEIENRLKALNVNPSEVFFAHDTICRQVSRRGPAIKKFAQSHDVVIFVSGANSSNGRYLFGLCKDANANSFWVQNETELKKDWLKGARSIGISGATSTPRWQMEKVAEAIKNFNN